jgi:hypothetical protein
MQFVTIEKQWQVGDAERPQEAAAHVPNHRARACVLKVTTVPPSINQEIQTSGGDEASSGENNGRLAGDRQITKEKDLRRTDGATCELINKGLYVRSDH